ncbi:hypothetical protein [Acinetobacter zhairhuonensis]|uniref:hypothetical protein n=1 Tax=Acinetobacter sp. A7.4 TaxID=2919921 RepID=UPI001F4D53FB|nr:hypothetical protein [Acinetobacter sp. A7.4]MCJ8160187.1 hypothetical protein [Acinetobacter sp. A7.4]
MPKTIVISLCLIFLTGCFQREEPVLPQEGEIVTWKQNDHLVVKAKLGERRKHIVDTHCRRCEAEFYQPEHEHYLGQFPIDYVPETFPPISKKEADSLPIPLAINQLEFNLVLNGSIMQAIDESIYVEDGLDGEDQVKVMVFNEIIKNRTSKIYEYSQKSNYSDFEFSDAKKWKNKYGLDCWLFLKTNSIHCYGKSSYDKSTGVLLKQMNANWIFAESFEPIYGGIRVIWRVDKRNLHHWREIDSAIWRLLETWNVSPISVSRQ